MLNHDMIRYLSKGRVKKNSYFPFAENNWFFLDILDVGMGWGSDNFERGGGGGLQKG